MALKSTIYKAQLSLADLDQHRYGEHGLTLALHPSETEERLMMRLLAFAMQVPGNRDDGELKFSRGLSDVDEPALWRHGLDGTLRQWVEVGLPDERRLSRACARSPRVAVYAYGSSVDVWWRGLASKLTRLGGLEVWQVPVDQGAALSALARRSMVLQCTLQDGHAWWTSADGSAELTLQPLREAAAA